MYHIDANNGIYFADDIFKTNFFKNICILVIVLRVRKTKCVIIGLDNRLVSNLWQANIWINEDLSIHWSSDLIFSKTLQMMTSSAIKTLRVGRDILSSDPRYPIGNTNNAIFIWYLWYNNEVVKMQMTYQMRYVCITTEQYTVSSIVAYISNWIHADTTISISQFCNLQ